MHQRQKGRGRDAAKGCSWGRAWGGCGTLPSRGLPAPLPPWRDSPTHSTWGCAWRRAYLDMCRIGVVAA
jgi:hypothetical protein